jgi:hypothetical protein
MALQARIVADDQVVKGHRTQASPAMVYRKRLRVGRQAQAQMRPATATQPDKILEPFRRRPTKRIRCVRCLLFNRSFRHKVTLLTARK